MTENNMKDFAPGDKIIVVMGSPGCGKTNFVAKASGKGEEAIGHDLENPPADVRVVRADCKVNGHNVVFVDTPPFDDSLRTDIEVLGLIAEFLVKIYKEHVKLAGIVYMHPMSKNRMDGTEMNSLKLFKSICGDNMSGVTIVTSMWDDVDLGVGETRETELRSNFWKEYMSEGCTTQRFYNTQDSALRIISGMVNNPGITLRIQNELVDQDKPLKDTKAAHSVSGIRAVARRVLSNTAAKLNKIGWLKT